MPYAFANGAGTAEDPYKVKTADDLNGVRDYLTAHFIQVDNIDLSGYANWEPITVFKGKYNGQGFKISNLYVDKSNNAAYCGLFGGCENAVLQKIGIVNAYIKNGDKDSSATDYKGVLAGVVNNCIIANCYVRGEVNRYYDRGGGFIGYTSGTTITNCYAVVLMSGSGSNSRTGAFAGYCESNPVQARTCYWDKNVALTNSQCYYDVYSWGKTTLEMKQQSTYEGWDFTDIWAIDPAINDGYPYLRVFEHEAPIIDDIIPSYVPQSSIKLTFTAGDSDPYDMGTYYADKSQYKVSQDTTKINARNSIGKYLKDQSFDEDCNFAEQAAADLIESILSVAGLTNYYVADDSTLMGFNFSPNKKMLEGIEEIIQYLSGWQIREEFSGKTVVAKYDNTEFTQPSTYTFQRNRDIFSREQVTDDRSVYGRICVHTSDFSVKVYRPITSNLGWTPPARKTLYQEVPDGTTSLEAAAIATDLATSMADTGRVETLICAFRPQIIPGDGAEILDSTGAVSLGTITQVKHTFGIQGFYTEIVVDSGGKIGKIKFKDIVNSLQPLPATVKT